MIEVSGVLKSCEIPAISARRFSSSFCRAFTMSCKRWAISLKSSTTCANSSFPSYSILYSRFPSRICRTPCTSASNGVVMLRTAFRVSRRLVKRTTVTTSSSSATTIYQIGLVNPTSASTSPVNVREHRKQLSCEYYKSIFAILNQPIFLHTGQFVRQGAPINTKKICKLLPV